MINFQYLLVKYVYGDHNSSKSVVRAVNSLIDELPNNGAGLNVGSGMTNLDSRIKNLELEAAPNIDYVGSVEAIPEMDSVFDLIISQEVLEHVKSPSLAIIEMRRVLKTGGRCYIQLPFIIGYHPCPNDYCFGLFKRFKRDIFCNRIKILITFCISIYSLNIY